MLLENIGKIVRIYLLYSEFLKSDGFYIVVIVKLILFFVFKMLFEEKFWWLGIGWFIAEYVLVLNLRENLDNVIKCLKVIVFRKVILGG